MNDGTLKPSSSIQALFQVNVAALVVGRETHSKRGYRLIASRAYAKGSIVFTRDVKITAKSQYENTAPTQ